MSSVDHMEEEDLSTLEYCSESITVVCPSSLSGSELNDDALLAILSFLDVASAVQVLRCTNHPLRQRGQDLEHKIPHLWRLWYDRLGYPPTKLLQQKSANDHILQALAESHRFSKNLMGRAPSQKNKSHNSNCFSLPNRWFSFLPVTPDDYLHHHQDDEPEDDSHMLMYMYEDPPPVSFDCDSFLLTGSGTEFVLLNPFTSTLTVYQSVLDHVIHSDEGMMEKAWRVASHRIVQQRVELLSSTMVIDPEESIHGLDEMEDNDEDDNVGDDDDDDNDDESEDAEHLLAADAIHETVHRNHYIRQAPYRVSPQQILVDLDQTINVPLEDYFPHRQPPRQNNHPDPNGFASEEEFELSHVGIDAKLFWDKDGVWQGTLLGLGRTISRLSSHNMDVTEESCMEIVAWTKGRNGIMYGDRISCRFPGAYNCVDVCPHQRVVYVNLSRDDVFMLWSGELDIRAMALTEDGQGYPVAQWTCQNPVTSMVVSPSYPGDTVLVGTSARTLEIYKRTTTSAICSQLISIPASVTMAYKLCQRQVPNRVHPAPVTEIFCAKEIPMEKAGFWTMQHNSVFGTSLLLWKLQPPKDPESPVSWEIATILNPPLSGHRTPKILYDGRRLLVYGQDHIGMILLVYQIRNSNENNFADVPVGFETSGGVLNVKKEPCTRFANRIRHVALSGMENATYESLYMTANERFVILNTKSGDLLSDSSTPYREGLLVIDLQDE